nr:uncharacterized protein LOC112209993 [Halyomorpha halys]
MSDQITGGSLGQEFSANNDLRQRDPLSATLFNFLMGRVVRGIRTDPEGTIYNRYTQVCRYTNDINLVDRMLPALIGALEELKREANRTSLQIDEKNTEYMNSTQNRTPMPPHTININGHNFPVCRAFKYLRALVTEKNELRKEVEVRITKRNHCFFAVHQVLKFKDLSWSAKVIVYKTTIRPTVTYGSETWVLTQAMEKRLCTWERKILRSPIAHITEYSVEKDNNGKPGCYTVPDSFWRKFFFYSILTVFFILPLSILIVLYTVIARHLIRDPGTANSGDNIRARKQVVLMLATVVLSFFLCLLPFRVFTFWVIISPDDITALGEQTYLNLLYFCRLMHYLNSAINPILYNLMSSKFRQGFGRLVGIRRKRHLLLLRHRATFSSTLSRSSTRLPRGSPDLSWRGASLDSRHRNGSIRRSVILRSSLLNHNKQPDPPPQPESYV